MKMNKNVEFTFEWYAELLEDLASDYDFVSYTEESSTDTVLLRHDVDWSPRKALEIAEIESDHDIESTYFFLLTTRFYNLLNEGYRRILHEISELGHNIGLHFSTHQYWVEPQGKQEVEETVRNEIEVLEIVSDAAVDTVSFHNPPDWVFRETYEGFVSTYEPRFFDEIEYVADSNQRWREEEPFQRELPERIQILTHPVLWGEEDASVTDRLEEERDYVFTSIEEFMEQENDLWS